MQRVRIFYQNLIFFEFSRFPFTNKSRESQQPALELKQLQAPVLVFDSFKYFVNERESALLRERLSNMYFLGRPYPSPMLVFGTVRHPRREPVSRMNL